MIKPLAPILAFALSLPVFAADTPPAGTAAAAPAPVAAPAAVPKAEGKNQHERMKALQATCNERADAHKIAGEARKAYVAKCLEGK